MNTFEYVLVMPQITANFAIGRKKGGGPLGLLRSTPILLVNPEFEGAAPTELSPMEKGTTGGIAFKANHDGIEYRVVMRAALDEMKQGSLD